MEFSLCVPNENSQNRFGLIGRCRNTEFVANHAEEDSKGDNGTVGFVLGVDSSRRLEDRGRRTLYLVLTSNNFIELRFV